MRRQRNIEHVRESLGLLRQQTHTLLGNSLFLGCFPHWPLHCFCQQHRLLLGHSFTSTGGPCQEDGFVQVRQGRGPHTRVRTCREWNCLSMSTWRLRSSCRSSSRRPETWLDSTCSSTDLPRPRATTSTTTNTTSSPPNSPSNSPTETATTRQVQRSGTKARGGTCTLHEDGGRLRVAVK